MADIRCDDLVCIVTGAGRGIGREHALLLAHHGAKVVVNDVGGARDGSGHDAGPAQEVVDEITSAGGTAVANADDIGTWDGGGPSSARPSRPSATSMLWSTTPRFCETGCSSP
jgi:NAD(P)-dependent dehydrogenase (short-subunit alcohol dehydrogenase family)